MTALSALWLPVLVSAVLVFLASFVLHMLLPWHKADHPRLPTEDKVMDALRPLNIPPGDYMIPCASDSKEMKSGEFLAKLEKGPVVLMTVMPSGKFNMGKHLTQWFIYNVVVSLFAAYVAGRALDSTAPYLEAFRFAGTTAFIGYALALWQMSIWYHRSWGTTIRNSIDGLIYGLLTGGVFGWLWPR
jgi:hypothetical protein